MNLRTIQIVTLAAAGLVASGGVMGTGENPDQIPCSVERLDLCLNGVGSGATSFDSLRQVGQAGSGAAREVAKEEKSAMLHGAAGKSAGDELAGWTVWGSATRSDYENTSVGFFDGDRLSGFFGADRFFGDQFVFGIALGYEDADNDTFFNGGRQDVSGFTVAPYGVLIVNDIVSIDASVGYSSIDTDQNRLDPNDGALLSSDFDSDRLFGAANVNLVVPRGNWVFGARFGFLASAEQQDGFTETRTARAAGLPVATRTVGKRHLDLMQGSIGADVGYGLGAWEPYVSATYRQDISRNDGRGGGGLPGGTVVTPDDKNEMQYGAGLRYFGSTVTGAAEVLKTSGRKTFDDTTFSITIRVGL